MRALVFALCRPNKSAFKSNSFVPKGGTMKKLVSLVSVLTAMLVLSACNTIPAPQPIIVYQIHRNIIYGYSESEADWIFAKNITTGENIALTGNWGDTVLLSVSRDGKKVLFRRDQTKELWSVNTDGTELKKILDISQFYGIYTDGTNDNGKYYYLAPTLNYPPVADWSPDGQRIVVAGPYIVCFYNTNGSGEDCINFDRTMYPNISLPTSIKWSPEGKVIAIENDYPSYYYQLTFFLRADNDGWNLTDEIEAIFPSWSPDGKEIAFWAYNVEAGGGKSGLGASLGITDSLHQNPIRLYRGPLVRGEPAWSPDGKKIVLSTSVRNDPPDPAYQLVVYNLADYSRKQITYLDKETNSSADFPVAWSPDGKKIAFSSRIYPPNLGHFVHQLRIVDTKTLKLEVLEEFGPEKIIAAIGWGFK